MGTGTVYTIASGKGGVGKTTFAVNFSAAVSSAEVDVVVVDVDFGMANLADHLGISAETPTIHDVLADRSDLDAAIRSVDGTLSALPGAVDLTAFAEIDPDGLVELVDLARERFDVVVLDAGAGLNYETALPLGLADGAVLVTTPTTSAVQDTRKTAELARRMQVKIDGLVVNRTTPRSRMSPDSIAENLDVRLLGSVPDSAAVEESLIAGEPVVTRAPRDGAADAIRSIAAEVTGYQIPRPVPVAPPSPPEPEESDTERGGLLARLFGR